MLFLKGGLVLIMVTKVLGLRLNQVIETLAHAGALDAETARSVVALGLNPRLTHRRAIVYLKRRKVLIQMAPDVYYVNLEAVQSVRQLQYQVLGIALVLLGALLTVPAMIG